MLEQNKKKEYTNHKDKIDEIKEQLYSRKNKEIKLERKKLKKKKFNFKDSWDKNNSEGNIENTDLYKFNKKGPSIFMVIFIIAFIFFLCAISFASFLFFFNKNEVGSEIKMSIVGPNSVKSGEPLEFLVNLENQTDFNYSEIEFTVSYPDSTINLSEKAFLKHKTIKYSENLLSGGKIGQKFSAILSGIRDEKKEIKVGISYKVGNFSNLLFLNKIYDVKIESSPVTIEMEYPAEVLNKEKFDIKVNVLSNSSEILNDLVIIGDYSQSFVVSKTIPKSVFSDEKQIIFKIKELKPGEKKKINISGSLVGQNNDNNFFTFTLGDSVPFRNEIRTLFSKTEKFISIKRPDIDLSISSEFDNENNVAIVPVGETIELNMTLVNNLSSSMSDLSMEVDLSGDLINKNRVNVPKGFYDSNNNKIIWNKNTDRFLKTLSGDGTIEELFSLDIKDLDDIAGYFKDPRIDLDFEVMVTNFNDESSSGFLKEKFKKVIKIPTEVWLETDIFYERGPFDNYGSYKPKVGEPTSYTVAWKIYNSSSDIFDVEVVAKLPLYVNYVDNVFPKKSYISYDEDKREVKLKFNKIDAFIGHRTDPKTVYFQVEMIPTSPQVGTSPVLIKQKTLRARDDFIGREIEITVGKKTTDMENDSIRGFNIGVVGE